MKNYFCDEDEKLKWTQGEKRKLLSTCVYDVFSQHNTSSTGLEGDYIIIDAKDWVIVMPEKDGKFIMVKQYRHGENSLSVEFPGGVIDEGEEPLHAALRELEEETGFKAGKITKLGCVNPNPALFSNHVHIFLAQELVQTGKLTLDEDEFINCMELSFEEILEGMGTEQFPHALMGTALGCYIKKMKQDGRNI